MWHASVRSSTRRDRERDLVAATRALFDERGLQDAPMEEIARAVGINKALIYRVFASKEELFVLTVTHYLDELREVALEPHEGLRDALDRFTRFCLRYPAFLDCALSLMRRPADELRERVGEGTWLRLGALDVRLPGAAGRGSSPTRACDDPDFAANRLYTQVLGTMHLARIGSGVHEAAPGVPGAFALDAERVRRGLCDAMPSRVARAAPVASGSETQPSSPEGSPCLRSRKTQARPADHGPTTRIRLIDLEAAQRRDALRRRPRRPPAAGAGRARCIRAAGAAGARRRRAGRRRSVLGRRLDDVALQLPVLAVELHDLHGLDRVAVVSPSVCTLIPGSSIGISVSMLRIDSISDVARRLLHVLRAP